MGSYPAGSHKWAAESTERGRPARDPPAHCLHLAATPHRLVRVRVSLLPHGRSGTMVARLSVCGVCVARGEAAERWRGW